VAGRLYYRIKAALQYAGLFWSQPGRQMANLFTWMGMDFELARLQKGVDIDVHSFGINQYEFAVFEEQAVSDAYSISDVKVAELSFVQPS
jgi:hypothetical protein